MTQVRFEISDNMSKAEELNILVRLQKKFSDLPNNYLASFFTQSLTNWAEQQMRNDFLCNIMEYVQQCSDRERELDQTRIDADKEIKDLKSNLKEREERIEGFMREVSGLRDDLNASLHNLETSEDEVQRLNSRLNDSASTSTQLADRIVALEKEVDGMTNKVEDDEGKRWENHQLKTEIIELKAKMYDLEHPVEK